MHRSLDEFEIQSDPKISGERLQDHWSSGSKLSALLMNDSLKFKMLILTNTNFVFLFENITVFGYIICITKENFVRSTVP